MSEKIEPKNKSATALPASKYLWRDVTLERASCNTIYFDIIQLK